MRKLLGTAKDKTGPIDVSATIEPTAIEEQPIPIAADLSAVEVATTTSQLVTTIYRMFAAFQLTVQDVAPQNISAYIKAHNIALVLQQEIIISLFDGNIDKKEKEKLADIARKIEPFYNLAQLFRDLAYKGQVEHVRALYPLVQDQLNVEFYVNLFEQLSEQNDPNLLEICNFFYDNHDDLYLLAIRFFGATMSIFPELGGCFSKLFQLMVKNKFAFYSMLLDHGLEPNNLAVLVDVKYAYLLPFTIYWGNSTGVDYSPFALKLIEKGATVEYPRIKFLHYIL